jgi:glycine C-acetyltransferase
MYGRIKAYLAGELKEIQSGGLFKEERIIVSPQSTRVRLADGRDVLNMCANNYLGLADHPTVVAAAREAVGRWGFGLSSVRFICGTQSLHKQLEASVSRFLGMEDTLVYSSCFDANGGLFEVLLNAQDAVISDALNHASIIDGIRLCKAQRYRYRHSDMADLEAKLKDAQSCRYRMIATDGVFSMDGDVAKLETICDLADQYDALVMVDDSHAVGFWGPNGRGTHEYCGVMDRVDILTGTFGKALGGASGGYTSGPQEIIGILRQRSRPYLFSNSVAPVIAAATVKAIDLLTASTALRDQLEENTRFFRKEIDALGFEIKPGNHPIVPIMLGDATLAQQMAAFLLEKGVYVIGFCYPVVPMGQARIRVQLSALHSREDLVFAVEQFKAAKAECEQAGI